MARVRPLSELPKVMGNMATAAKLMPKDVVPVLARNVGDEVRQQASPFHIKGRNGRPVQLTVKIRKAGSQQKPAAIVGGEPIGFWRIVEGGSQPHLITTLGLRTSRRGRVSRRSVLTRFAGGEAIGGKPLRIPGIGFRQFAMHPGHGPLGQPWRKSMAKADSIVARSLKEHATRDMTKAWLK